MTEFWAGKTVLLTGHTGFKGSWMSLWLHEMGAKVYGYALDPDTTPSLFDQLGLDDIIHHKIGDICDRDTLTNYIIQVKPDVIFHMAAQSLVLRGYKDAPLTWDVNVMGTVNILETLRHLDHPCTAVMITTDKVYHNNEWEHGYREDDPLGGLDPYSASKAACELAISSYSFIYDHEERPIRVASARAGNVIGGGDWCANRLVPDIARALQNEESIETRNPGATRPWQHVLEPLDGYMCLAEKLSQNSDIGTAFNFGPAARDNRTVENVIQTALKYWPGHYHTTSVNNAPHEAGLLKLSIERAQSRLGWSPRWSFEIAIDKTISWYKLVHEGADPLHVTRAHIVDYQNT